MGFYEYAVNLQWFRNLQTSDSGRVTSDSGWSHLQIRVMIISVREGWGCSFEMGWKSWNYGFRHDRILKRPYTLRIVYFQQIFR